MSIIDRERSFSLVDLASAPGDNTIQSFYDGTTIKFFEDLPIKIDGVIPSVGDFVLYRILNGNDPDLPVADSRNGIWEVTEVTGGGNFVTMSKRLKLTTNKKFFTLGGNINAGKYYIVDNTGRIVNGLTQVEISQYFPPNPILTPP